MNIYTRLTIVATLVALLGIAQIGDARSEDLKISFDPSFPNYERATVLRVVNEWNSAMKGVRRIEIAEGGRTLVMLPGAPILSKGRCEGGLDQPGRITLYQGCMAKGALAPYLRHEIGHALGLPHMARTVMDPTCCYDWQSIDSRAAEVAMALGALVAVRVPR